MWLARVSSRLDDARLAARADAQARRGRRVRPARHLRRASRPPRRSRPPTATSTPPSRCSSSAAATIRAPPRPATAGGCRCSGPAWPSRPATSAPPPSSPRPPSRSRRGARWACSASTSTSPPARATSPRPASSSPGCSRRWPRRATRRRRRCTTCWPACLAGGMTPDELRPLVDLVGVIPGHRFDADHPLAPAHRRAARRGRRRHRDGRPPLRRRRRQLARRAVRAAAPRTAAPPHVGAARCLIALGALDDALPHAEAAAELLSRWRGWRVDELVAVQRRLGIGSEPDGPAELTPASGRWPRCSPRASATRVWPSGSTSPRAPRPCTCRTSSSKLGMASRTEVAAWAAREGLTSGG